MTQLVIGLIAYCLVRECIYLYTTHKLVNKIMSRSFHEYQIANNSGKIVKKPEFIKVDDTPDEEFATIF